MPLKPCIKATANLNDSDVESILDSFDSYADRMDQDDAARLAIDDEIAGLEQERQETLDLVHEAHPDTRPQVKVTPKPKTSPRNILSRRISSPPKAPPPQAPGVMIRNGKVVMVAPEYQFVQPYDFVQHAPRIKARPSVSIEKGALHSLVGRLQEDFPGLRKLNFHIFNRQDEAFGPGSKKEHGIIRGGFYAGTNEVVLIAEHLKDENDVIGTLRHELAGHYGLRELLNGEGEFDRLLQRVYKARHGALKAQYDWVAKYYPDLIAKNDVRTIADEMLARAAEAQTRAGIIRQVYDQIIKLLNKYGLARGPISLEHLESLIRAGEANLRKKHRPIQEVARTQTPMLASRGAPGPIWVSGVKKAVEDLPMEKGPASQFLNMLRKLPKKKVDKNGNPIPPQYAQGVKAEEFELLGLEEFLSGNERITKQEILNFVSAGGIQLQDVILGGTPSDVTLPTHPGIQGTDLPPIRGSAQYQQYKLPGGSNYGEVLLTLPVVRAKPAETRGLPAPAPPGRSGRIEGDLQTLDSIQQNMVDEFTEEDNEDYRGPYSFEYIRNDDEGDYIEFRGFTDDYIDLQGMVETHGGRIVEDAQALPAPTDMPLWQWYQNNHDEYFPGWPARWQNLVVDQQHQVRMRLDQLRAAGQQGLPTAAAPHAGDFDVTTDAGIKDYLRWLIQNEMTYHFDDGPDGIDWQENATPEQIAVVNQMHNQLPDMRDWFDGNEDWYEAYAGNAPVPQEGGQDWPAPAGDDVPPQLMERIEDHAQRRFGERPIEYDWGNVHWNPIVTAGLYNVRVPVRFDHEGHPMEGTLHVTVRRTDQVDQTFHWEAGQTGVTEIADGAPFEIDETEIRDQEPLGGGQLAPAVIPGNRLPQPDVEFTGGHFSSYKNILAHVRMDERMVNGEKVLFIEEIQSDWHQAGRKRGYKGRPATPFIVRNIMREEFGPDGVNQFEMMGPQIVDYFNAAAEQRADAGDDLGLSADQLDKLKTRASRFQTAAVPDVPFKKTWPLLAMKRMIRYAADNGYDRISWTTGQQQADRYSLGSHIERLEVQPDSTGNYTIAGFRNNMEVVRESNIHGNDLGGYIGEELAEKVFQGSDQTANLEKHSKEMKKLDKQIAKIVDPLRPESMDKATWRTSAFMMVRDRNTRSGIPRALMPLRGTTWGDLVSAVEARDEAFQKWVNVEEGVQVFEGLDLDIGGHGMKAFYDLMLPGMVGEYIKKHNSRIDEFPLTGAPPPPARPPALLGTVVEEGIDQRGTGQGELMAEYEAWLDANDIPEDRRTSADELLMEIALTPDQRAWLRGFIERWEMLKDLEILGYDDSGPYRLSSLANLHRNIVQVGPQGAELSDEMLQFLQESTGREVEEGLDDWEARLGYDVGPIRQDLWEAGLLRGAPQAPTDLYDQLSADQLLAMHQWNDSNGDFEELTRDQLIEAARESDGGPADENLYDAWVNSTGLPEGWTVERADQIVWGEGEHNWLYPTTEFVVLDSNTDISGQGPTQRSAIENSRLATGPMAMDTLQPVGGLGAQQAALPAPVPTTPTIDEIYEHTYNFMDGNISLEEFNEEMGADILTDDNWEDFIPDSIVGMDDTVDELNVQEAVQRIEDWFTENGRPVGPTPLPAPQGRTEAEPAPNTGPQQPSFPISEELRDLALRGQPLFRRGEPGPRGLKDAFTLSRKRHFKNIRELKVALQEQAKQAPIDLVTPSEELEKFLIGIGADDAEYALKDHQNAVGWYDKTVTKALEVLSLIHPELNTDENARFAFTYALAVTSNGMKVGKNFEMAEEAYDSFKHSKRIGKKYGAMPTDIGAGTAAPAINAHMQLFNDMAEQYGIDHFREFMTREFTVGEIRGIDGLDVSGELVGTRVIGGAILGAKIGNGFFANLNGMFDRLTMDRWLMRTWGRWTGTLLTDRPDMIKKKRRELSELIRLLAEDKQRRQDFELALGMQFKLSGKKGVIGIDDVARQIAKASVSPRVRQQFNQTPVGAGIRKAGNNLAKWLDGQKEAPANGTERNWIRQVFAGILGEMHKKGYNEMTMADLQALLWYPEKRLYDSARSKNETMEGYEDDEAPDYANAAVALAKKQGIGVRKINGAIKRAEKSYDDKISAAGARGSTGLPTDTSRPTSNGQAAREGKWLFRRDDQTETPEFKAWAGTESPVIPSFAINDTDFSGPGPFVMRAYHGTTHDFSEFDASVLGNKEGQFGAVNYFTSDRGDAGMNYAGEGPDLTSRIDQRAEQIASELADMTREEFLELAEGYELEDPDSGLAFALAREELAGNEPQTLELFVRTEKPFVVGVDESPWMEFIDWAEMEKQAIETVALDEGLTTDEIEENLDEYERQIEDARYDIEAYTENPFVEAVNAVVRRYDVDTARLMEDIEGFAYEGGRQAALEKSLRESDALMESYAPETGQMESSHIIGEIIRELGYDSIILKNAGGRFQNMGISTDTAHIQVFDINNTNIKSATDNTGTFDPNDPNFLKRRFIEGLSQAPTGGNLGMPEETLKERFVRYAQDSFNRVKKLQQEVTAQGGRVNYKSDVYRVEELSSSKISHRLKFLERDYMRPLLEIMDQEKLTIEELDLWLIAKHASERNEYIASINDDMQDGGSGMTYQQARDVTRALSHKREALNQAAGIVHSVNEQHLDDLVDGGHLDQATVDTWRNRWDNYVPLKGKDGQTFRPGTGTGYNISGANIKRALGRGADNLPQSPTAHSFAQAESAIVRTEKTKVGQALIELIRDNPDPEFWTISERNYKKFEDVFGEPFEGYEDPPEGLVEDLDYTRVMTSEGKVAYRLDPNYKRREDVFSVMVDGTELLVQIKDALLIEQLKKMNTTQLNAVVAGFGQVNRYLAMINTALNPEFVITNFERDFQTAMVNLGGEHSAAIAGRVAAGIPGAIRGIWQATFDTSGQSEWRQTFEEMESEGGTIGFFGLEDIDTKVKKIQRKLLDRHGVLGRTKKGIATARDLILDANLSVENAARLSAYKVIRDEAIANGLSQKEAKQRAASVAKNLTVNFNRKGELAPVLNSAYLFYNASIQGSFRILTALSNPRVRKIVGGLAATAFALAMYNRSMGGDDDDEIPYWDKISDYTKQTNLIIMDPAGTGEYTKIRLPYGYNVFWYAGTASHDLMFDPRKGAVEQTLNMLSATMNAYNPIQGADLLDTLTPTFLKPYEQDARNINFMGAPLKPENPFDNYDRPESQKFFKSTNPLLRELFVEMNKATGGDETHAGWADFSPEIVKHYVSWLTGGAGMTVTRAVGTAANLATGEEIVPRNVPFWRTVRGEPGTYFDRERYYDAVKQVNAVEKQLDILGRGTSERQDYLDANRDVHNLSLHMRSYKNKIKRLSEARDKAYADGDNELGAEKREEIRQQMIEFSMKYEEAVAE